MSWQERIALDPVDLPDGSELMCEARFVRVVPDSEMGEINDLLDRRRRSHLTDTAARHNEHQL
jgi:hypothetical protein